MDLSWMAWTWPTAALFSGIALGVAAMTIWQFVSPSEERAHAFGITTTRGDRFFVSLLGFALIELAWMGLIGDYFMASAVVCLLYSWAVFRWY